MNKKYILIGLIIVIFLILIILVRIDNKTEKISRKNFEYHYTINNSSNNSVRYKVECNDKCNITINDRKEKKEYEISKEYLKELEEILTKYSVYRWNGYNKVNKKVKDGKSFTLKVTLENNKTIKAHGYMSYPNNYKLVKEEIDLYFNNIIK